MKQRLRDVLSGGIGGPFFGMSCRDPFDFFQQQHYSQQHSFHQQQQQQQQPLHPYQQQNYNNQRFFTHSNYTAFSNKTDTSICQSPQNPAHSNHQTTNDQLDRRHNARHATESIEGVY